jgi:hypothetical protein
MPTLLIPPSLEVVMQGLYDSEIRCGIQNEPPAGGITAWIDYGSRTEKATFYGTVFGWSTGVASLPPTECRTENTAVSAYWNAPSWIVHLHPSLVTCPVAMWQASTEAHDQPQDQQPRISMQTLDAGTGEQGSVESLVSRLRVLYRVLSEVKQGNAPIPLWVRWLLTATSGLTGTLGTLSTQNARLSKRQP